MALENQNPKYKWSILGASVSNEVLRALEDFRGNIPRSKVVEQALREYLIREMSKQASGERVNNRV